MILRPLAAVKARQPSFFDHMLEVPVIGVAEHTREVAAGPMFLARRIHPFDLLERRLTMPSRATTLIQNLIDHLLGSLYEKWYLRATESR